MKNLFSLLLVAALVPVGAQALSAQQAQDTMKAKTTQTTHQATPHTRKLHRRHTSKVVARHARAEHETAATERREVRHARMLRHHPRARSSMNGNVVMTRTPPVVLGTPAPGFAPPPAAASMPTRNLPRLSNGLITLDAARSIALRTVPGGTSVTKIQRHTEDGREVYDVKVMTPNQTGNEMVRVDAHTGAVVETKNVDNPVGTVKGAVNKAVNKVKHP